MKIFRYLLLPSLALTLSSCLSTLPMTGNQRPTQDSTTTSASQQEGGLGSLGDVLSSIIAGATGSYTTTQASLVGTWNYSAPAVQFESENLLAQAGGAAAASQVEQKLAPYYQKVGIVPGSLLFTFAQDGQMSYQLGQGQAIPATYVFDNASKTVTITTRMGLHLKAYVTVSGQTMSLCFDSSKLLSLISMMGQGQTSAIGQVAQSFDGMKTGFKFSRQ